MKYAAILGYFLLSTLSAQLSVQNTKSKFSSGEHPCLLTEIQYADDEFCMKEWKKFIDGFKNEKIKKSGNEIFSDNVLFNDFGNNPADVYTKFEYQKKQNKTLIFLAVDLGGAFLNASDHPDKQKKMQDIFKKYASSTQKKFLEEKLESQKNELGKLTKKITSLEEENKDLNDKIFKWENNIKKNEKEISDTKAKLQTKKGEVEAQKKVVSSSSGAVKEQQKSSEKILEKLQDEEKELENNIKKLENENQSLRDKIKDAREKIKNNEQEIQNLRQKSEQQHKEIRQTESEISAY